MEERLGDLHPPAQPTGELRRPLTDAARSRPKRSRPAAIRPARSRPPRP